MKNNENGDETYSLIFKSLKHPIRRKILRMLQEDELTFSQILQILSMDSGHLSYHLENLSDLLSRSPDGKYRLSSFGIAAVKLMSGVEEYKPPSVSPSSVSRSRVDAVVKIMSIVLAVALLWSSLYSISFTTSASSLLVRTASERPGISLELAPDQTFVYNLTLIYGGYQMVATEPNGLRMVIKQPVRAANEWERYFVRLNLEFNGTYGIILMIHDPSNNLISNSTQQGAGGGQVGIPGAYLDQPGTYDLEIRNVKSTMALGNLSLEIMQEWFERPMFYYGLAGAATALLYPLTLFLSWLWMKKTKPIKIS